MDTFSKWTLFILFLLLSYSFSCEKDKVNSTENLELAGSLSFGTYYGHCRGECATIYRIQDGALFADDNVTNLYEYFEKEIPFQQTALPDSEYQKAKVLLETFPKAILDLQESTIGIPDAHDQGGIFLEYEEADFKRRWFLDTVIDRLPKDLQDYAKSVRDIMTQIE